MVDPPREGAYESLVLDTVREGYLLHYGEPRLLAGHDDDLALLAGDYLYALGIERLATLGDTAAVLVLADLIGDCAQAPRRGQRGGRARAVAGGGERPSPTPPPRVNRLRASKLSSCD